MKKLSLVGGVVLAAGLGVFTIVGAQGFGSGNSTAALNHVPNLPSMAVCGHPGQGEASCHSRVVTDPQGRPKSGSKAVAGYGPMQFLGAYNLGSGQANGSPIIAVVDAYDDPNIASDLKAYSTYFHIPNLPSCSGPIGSAASACLEKVNQNGGTKYPAGNQGWALEISLDVEIAHAVCQNCRVLLVEANSASYGDLMAAVDRARLMGAAYISNSYGSGEFSGETAYDSYFDHPGTVFTFSAGDNGYGAGYPASSPYVTAVGGTTLAVNTDNSYAGEAAWSGTGSGCSAYESKPSWQTDTLCAGRTMNDVAADADPSTGAAVYDSYGYYGQRGWFEVGGTSLSSPIIAATYALAGNVPATVGASLLYSNPSAFHDVTSGSNGSCGVDGLCSSTIGYDAPTGLGTPNGLGAF